MAERKRVFSLPPGVPFLATVAEALCDGRLVPGFRHRPEDPLSLAGATIYVPTRRAVRALRSEFVDRLGGGSAILPLIRPLGESDDDIGFFDEDHPALLDLSDPLPSIARLIELARLVLAWRNALPEAIVRIHGDTPIAAPASPADAIWLARDLASLIDALETEEIGWEALADLKTADYAHWWQLSAEFLKIASAYWPARLAEMGRSSAARHRNALLRLEAERLSQAGAEGPVIIAGSTGSLKAAADFIDVVSRLPQGCVVLPGLSHDLSDDHWQAIAPPVPPGRTENPSTRCHPQYGLFRLLQKLAIGRADVLPLATAPAALQERAAIIARALGPADTTEDWLQWRQGADPGRLAAAFADVALIEAASEQEEALAIAIALRLALEQPGRAGPSRAALITPDRNLARRVKSELERFGIIADDTAGTPLNVTPQGTLAILVAECCLRPGDPVAVASLLKHPLCRFGSDRDTHDRAVRALEAFALRGGTSAVDLADLSGLLEEGLAAHAGNRKKQAWRLGFSPDSIRDAGRLAETLAIALEPLVATLSTLPLSDWAERLGRVLEAAVSGPDQTLGDFWGDEPGAALAALLSGIMEHGRDFTCDGPQWIDSLLAFMAGEKVKPSSLSHPRVFIFGSLEARLQAVDTMILGGMNEGQWPGDAGGNPFLSRTMKAEIGLEPPERRIGQLAHDFEMANGVTTLIYSRALKQAGAPSVASRWLQRLTALIGPETTEALRQRGSLYLSHARQIDAGGDGSVSRAASRPSPVVPLDLQPDRYSFSEAGRLRRDPYALYARKVLRLDPLEPFNAEPGPAERGTLYHRVFERFIRSGVRAASPEGRETLHAILTEVFDAEGLPPHVDAVWRPRFREVAEAFIAWQKDREPGVDQSLVEVPAALELENGILLTGIADRIDILPDGTADLIDYKTGASPSTSVARALLDPQLPLEAAVLARGGFRDVAARSTRDLLYVRLRPGDRFKQESVNNRDHATGDLAADAMAQLTAFTTLLRSGQKGFMSRLIPESDKAYGGEYDHLARVAEWSVAEDSEEAGDEA